jgi:hypothetical protein
MGIMDEISASKAESKTTTAAYIKPSSEEIVHMLVMYD